jgi:CheY-like chemotaxis protein
MLTKPANTDDARKLVEICIRTKIPTRVLVVDDSGTMRSIVRKILSASRFALDIHEAAEGIAALDQLRTGNFGIVFLDYNMPGLNGFETLSEIKRENPSVAVVIMTSTVDNLIADRAHASGALAFLKKPFYPADVDAVLERHYGLHAPIG